MIVVVWSPPRTLQRLGDGQVRQAEMRPTAQVTGPATAGYEALLAQGANTVQMGAISVAGTQGALTPVSVSVGGDACALTVQKNPYE